LVQYDGLRDTPLDLNIGAVVTIKNITLLFVTFLPGFPGLGLEEVPTCIMEVENFLHYGTI
jgi:hypothetical protein